MARKKTSTPPPAWLHTARGSVRTLILLAMFIAVAGVMSWTFAGILLHTPFWREYRAARELQLTQQKVAAARAERVALQKNIDWYRSPQGAEALIRSKGWLRSDEIGVRVQIEEPAAANAQATPAPASAAPKRTLSGVLQLGLAVFATAFAGMACLLLYRWRKWRAKRPVGVLTPRSELRRRRRQTALHEH